MSVLQLQVINLLWNTKVCVNTFINTVLAVFKDMKLKENILYFYQVGDAVW